MALLARWNFDEAASGTGPGFLIDSSNNELPVNMAINYAAGSWSTNAGGRVLSLPGTALNGGISGFLANTKIAKALQGSTQCTLVIEIDTTLTSGFMCGGGIINDTNGAQPLELEVNATQCRVFWNDSQVGTGTYTAGLNVFHLVVDTTQSAAADRVKLYVNNSLLTLSGTAFPAQNTAIDTFTSAWGTWSVVAGRYGATNAIHADIAYMALYSDPISSTRVAAQYTALLANNDADPEGPTVTSWLSKQCVGEGATATFSVTATGTGTLHYQWKVNGSNVGTDSSGYTTGALTMADNASTVQCVVTDSNGSANSNTAYLNVVPRPRTAWLRA